MSKEVPWFNARYALGKLHNDTTSYRKTRRVRRCAGSARRNGARPAHGHQMHELGSIDVMCLDQTLGQSRHVACAVEMQPLFAIIRGGPREPVDEPNQTTRIFAARPAGPSRCAAERRQSFRRSSKKTRFEREIAEMAASAIGRVGPQGG